MPKLATPLTDTRIKNAKSKEKPYTLADGGGMYLEVMPSGSKIWRMAYRQANGKNNRLTFGQYPEVSLATARQKRADARATKATGTDPAMVRRNEKRARATAASNTFEGVARAFLSKSSANRAPSTQQKNTVWLEKNIFPCVGKRPISEITPTEMLAALQKVEMRGAVESAHKIKQLCGQIFRFAVASGLAQRDVTADLKGALSAIPKGHYAAITEPVRVGQLLRAIDGYDGNSFVKAALKFAPLVFVRPGELRTAEWSEIDLAKAQWRIPAAKMKMGVEHVVPLSRQAVDLLQELSKRHPGGHYVFPSVRTSSRCISDNTLNAALRSMGFDGDTMTAHGFRAMARTILDEVLQVRPDLIEHQLAHAVRDPLGRAYNRTSHLPARQAMMQQWADYLDSLK